MKKLIISIVVVLSLFVVIGTIVVIKSSDTEVNKTHDVESTKEILFANWRSAKVEERKLYLPDLLGTSDIKIHSRISPENTMLANMNRHQVETKLGKHDIVNPMSSESICYWVPGATEVGIVDKINNLIINSNDQMLIVFVADDEESSIEYIEIVN